MDLLVTYFKEGVLSTDVISSSELMWYLKNTSVMKVSDLGWLSRKPS